MARNEERRSTGELIATLHAARLGGHPPNAFHSVPRNEEAGCEHERGRPADQMPAPPPLGKTVNNVLTVLNTLLKKPRSGRCWTGRRARCSCRR
jgi:hypothetical protein